MKVFHQSGHNNKWNLESYKDDNCGDGIIFSPVHLTRDKIISLPVELRRTSLFDPQFYIPDSQKTKLQTYEFFPEKITNGFSTTDFETVAYEAADLCLDFQLNFEFESIIVPARYFPELVSNYIDRQKAFAVEPFLSALEKKKVNKKVFLTLPVTTAMTQDSEYRQNLLNWITSYQEITGVYLLNEMGETSKQISTFEKLMSHLEFIRDLKSANLDVIVGYCNTEAILISALDPYALTFGAYENTRRFSIDKFLEDESEKRGPAPRLYFPKLLNWIRYDTAVEIRDDHPDLWSKIYVPTTFSEATLTTGSPHFTQPNPYKHHFALMNSQLRELASQEVSQRISLVKTLIHDAKKLHDEIEGSGIMYFDRNCSGDHLPVWNRVINKI
jgi:hypothetical protein